MDPSASSRSGDSTTYTPEAEEIQSLINHGLTGSSFTALLGLPPNQAVDLLHEPGRDEIWREKVTLPANAALVDRAARFSVFAAEEGDRSPAKPKAEVEDYGDRPIWTIEGEGSLRKRKDGGKAKGCCLKKKKGAEEDTGGENKLPYIHVRARRGQATDSHSLAERARREKINARMKLLQNLVPGCSKITSTALALDEIISHVLTLRQLVDTLSMRLAVMNHAVNFSSIDHFLSVSEFLRPTAMNERSRMALDQAMMCSEVAANGMQQQVWHADGVQQQQGPSVCWEKGGDATAHPFLNSSGLSFTYDSAAAVSLPNQLKTEEEL